VEVSVLPEPVILLATEGTYPYHLGGVSTWCDTLVRNLPRARFIVFAVAMNPYVSSRFEMPNTVKEVITVPLWGTQDPSEHRTDMAFSQIFMNKQRTTTAEIERAFLPLLGTLLEQVARKGEDPEVLGETLAALNRHFQIYDYQSTFKSLMVWDFFRQFVLDAALRGVWPEPSVFEAVQALGWIYHFLTILNTTIPRVDLVHASAAAFCGMAAIVAKIQYGCPFLLTEHGVYLREQYLSVGRSNMSPFSKRFLLSLISAIVRANLFYADELSPVCAFNARWEKILGADPARIRVIHNGVSPQVFHPRARRPDGPEASAPLRVLCVARSDPNKDLETLLRAVSIVKGRLPDLKVVVRGAMSVPAYHEKMLALRAELGLKETVDFAGHVADVAEAYAEADIVVQSSVSEAFPYSVIEAMMSGVAVVATDVGGTREAVGDTGIMVPSKDPARLATGILMLAQDPRLRQELGEAARQRALNFFTTERTLDRYWETYLRMSGMAGSRTDPLRMRQKVALDRSQAFLRLGLKRQALGALREALAATPVGPASAALMAGIASIERELGLVDESAQHLIGAWLLKRLEARSPMGGLDPVSP